MRIISGLAKGKKILNPADKKTRPLKDMVRESIFNILNHSSLLQIDFNESVVLDLFSGVGSFGLEAISRGAKKVVFYENYKEVSKLLMKNLETLSFDNKAEIHTKNIYKENCFDNLEYNFDLIFIDPPFKDTKLQIIFNNIINAGIIKSKTLVVIHRKKISIDDFGENFKKVREEIYGSSKIIFGFLIF